MTARLGEGVTLVLGGARSGKSAYAERLIESSGRTPVYIATGRAFDGEMETRIAAHRARRGLQWRTVEAPLALCQTLRDEAGPQGAVLVDCLTLWLTNLMLEGRSVTQECDALVSDLASVTGPVVLVSNEVGLGIVPDNRMAREFRDHAGRLHQAVAAMATTVVFVAAGLPLTMKG
ncbi:bifunctional adenosylcobinamide kinase/adenosylcobinamide-phosphate guanylyltransferase [Aurantimonas sp. HBX-1]|uniref:bifunctional adenosylcobinamide kinase/adenosylcobinamide-phosphate guanylyltransferase n=1 Tax=Aurantimonas sp. HBX-1 TaxID=2906072 RepID=UPI001F347CB0|nr:bifunctional adenosylcobinamide kinase/adenosylcobinamide-phosphate guanylyltransferase [Aurantimonas sp. HBX-1]UIJ70725.1 bifunctional adenosylcobinamide kinase/adenosylcobinamide-phosphate guanylyltransferase [Aurantimonas sp. HBX-1]